MEGALKIRSYDLKLTLIYYTFFLSVDGGVLPAGQESDPVHLMLIFRFAAYHPEESQRIHKEQHPAVYSRI